MSRFYEGLIVNTAFSDGHGSTKIRPAVVIAGCEDWEQTGEILVVPITSNQDRNSPTYHILVHDREQFDDLTGLDRPCWAKCNWACWIEIRRIQGKRGDLPDSLLTLVVDAFDAIFNDPNFNDWHGA